MQTIAVLSQKGGSGKTTLALHLAVAAEQAGKIAAVIDIDPQASAAGWKDSRTSETPVVVSIPAARLAQALDAAEAPRPISPLSIARPTPVMSRWRSEAADFVLIPCRPGILDLRAIGATARIVKLAGKQGSVVLNAMPPNAPHVLSDARAAVAVHGLDVAPIRFNSVPPSPMHLRSGKRPMNTTPKGRQPKK